MEDTLRYFFSAVFQGFAAIITLGIMFYLYYLDKFRKRLEDIENFFHGYKPPTGTENDFYVKEHGLILFVKNIVLPPKKDVSAYDYARRLVSIYEEKIDQKKILNKKLLSLFKNAILIILISLIALFSTGYVNWLNYILFIAGILNIILSFIFFINLFSFIKSIINTP